jgi:hypothetical protein
MELSKELGSRNKEKVIMSDEIISADEVVVSPRGRKIELIPELCESLKALKKGQALRLATTIGEVPKEKRSAVSQMVRKHWRHVRNDDLRIDYDMKGVPQVRVKG